MKRLMWWTVIGVLVVASSLLVAQRGKKKARGGNRVTVTAQIPGNQEVIGTVRYESGAAPDELRSGPGTASIGNRFNSDQGNPLQAGTVTAITFFPANNTGTALLTVFGPPNTMGSAAVISGFSVSGVVNNAFNVAPSLAINVGTDFLVGMYVPSAMTANGSIGLRSASFLGQGFHAMSIQYNPATGTGFTAIANRNAMVRVSGDTLVPVELMNFSVD